MRKSWEQHHKSSLRRLRGQKPFRRTFNIFLPIEVDLKGLDGWLVLDKLDGSAEDQRYAFVAPKGL